MKFGIVGCGVIAHWHAQSICELDGAELVGVTTPNPEKCSAFAHKYDAQAFGSLEALLESNIDAICICTPSGLHAKQIVAAADAHKHIVVEKPIGIIAKQLDEIEDACARNHVRLCAISQLLFSPAVEQVKSAIDSGAMGQMLLGDVIMKYYRPPEYYKQSGWHGTWALDGGGALMNQGIHGIQLLLYFMGAAKRVFAFSKTLVHDIETDDTSVAVVEFKNGAVGTITGTTSIRPGMPRLLNLHGQNGTISLEENTITRWEVEGQKSHIEPGTHKINTSADPTAFPVDGHKAQIQDFIEAVNQGRQPRLDEHEGRKAVDLILAIYQSEQTGLPVSL